MNCELLNPVVIVLIILFILVIICISRNKKTGKEINKEKKKEKEKFISEYNDPSKDGKMKFTYLTEKNYGKNILDTYYQNDDARITGVRAIYHPFQIKSESIYGVAPRVNVDRALSNQIFNDYGVRL